MKRQALIIGINRYPWLKDKPTDEGKHLDAPYHDAIAIAEMLDRPQEHPDFAWCVERLLSDKETGKVVRANELRDAIRNLFLPNTQTPPEVALLFFAGHGLRDNNGKVYLAHSNVKPRTSEWGFPLDELREWMQESKIPHQIVFLDCCHSGDLVQGMANLTVAEVQQWNLGGSRFIVAACRDDLETKGVDKRGVLTEALLQGLDPQNQPANEWVTTYSLYDFLDREFGNNSLLRQQIPLLYPPAKSIKFWMGTKTGASSPSAGEPTSSSSRNQFSALIADKTKDFVGREYVFDAIAQFISSEPNGYFTITGDPGQGKSAILAKYVQDTGCIAHFNVQVVGPKSADKFLESVCTQLIDRYFPSRTLPSNATQDGEFLGQLLEEVAARRNNKPVIIAVDALDEVDSNSDRSANILYLPLYLPEGIYFVMTIRRGVEVPFFTHTSQESLSLYLDYQEDSQRDVRQYIHNRVNGSERLRSRIEERRETLLLLIDKIAAKSENNFMYLRYVLQDIEKGLYQDLTLERFPQGLQSYYGFHWRRMGMTATPLPDEKIKIVYILGEVLQPVSSQQICDFSGEDKRTVQAVLNEWEQFLHELEKDRQKRYIVYYASFRDFLHQKDILEKTGVTIPGINQLIVNSLTKGLFDDEEDI
jgi:serine/threonine-protein kinase